MKRLKQINFTAYEKIAEDASRWQMDEASARLFAKTEWVVTEKVHGANFCFVTDGVTVRCAKRKRLLGEGESFFHYERVLNSVQEQIQAAFFLAKAHHPTTKSVMIYGELFGGGYPHPDIKADPNVQLVQTGVYYSPTIDFYAFDIALDHHSDNGASERHYLDYDQALQIFQKVQLFHAQPLFVGKWNDANGYPIGFDSTIPALLGLPPLSQPNPAEGIIIKPVKSFYIETKKGRIRPIIKKKIAAFAEDKRFHQAHNVLSLSKGKWPTTQTSHNDEPLAMLKWEIFNLVTENRLINAISKVGISESAKRTQARLLFNMVLTDVLEELSETQEHTLQALSHSQAQQLRAYLYQQVRQLFQDFFKTEGKKRYFRSR